MSGLHGSPSRSDVKKPELAFQRSATKADARRATAATELALMLPILMTLVLGGVDFSRIIYDYIAVSNASRVGAEYGATHHFTPYTRSSWESRLTQAVVAEMASSPTFDPTKLTVAINVVPDSYNLVRITVDVEYPFSPIVRWPALPQQVQLWRRTSMREIQ